MLQQDGSAFNSEQEAPRHLDRIKTDLRHGVQQGTQMLIAGLHYLKELGSSLTASFAGKILKNLKSPKKLSRLIDEKIIQNNQALSLFLDDIKPLLESGDARREQWVLSVMVALFSSFPQPAIFSVNLLRREQGIDVAEPFYTKVVELIKNPALDYFAANFLKKMEQSTRQKGGWIACAITLR